MNRNKHRGIPAQSTNAINSVLNSDLIHLILDQLYWTKTIPEHARLRPVIVPDYATLSRCSRISKTWRNPSQKLLFYHVQIINDRQFKSFQKVMASQSQSLGSNRDFLRESIRVLETTISPKGVGGFPHGLRQLSSEEKLLLLLEQMPMLYELKLTVEGGFDSFQPSTLSTLSTIPSSLNGTLKSLRLAMRTLGYLHHKRCIVPLQFLNVDNWCLEYFSVKGLAWGINQTGEFPALRHRFKEVRVTKDADIEDGANLDDLLDYLTANSTETLIGLHCPYFRKAVSTQFAAQLETLAISTYGLAHLSSLGTDKFDCLRELLLPVPVDHNQVVGNLSAALPPQLEHLAFATRLAMNTSDWIERLLLSWSSVSSSLRRITILILTKDQKASAILKNLEGWINTQIQQNPDFARLKPVLIVIRDFSDAWREVFASDMVQTHKYPRDDFLQNMGNVNRSVYNSLGMAMVPLQPETREEGQGPVSSKGKKSMISRVFRF